MVSGFTVQMSVLREAAEQTAATTRHAAGAEGATCAETSHTPAEPESLIICSSFIFKTKQ